VPFLAV
jgi:hypothetical protein